MARIKIRASGPAVSGTRLCGVLACVPLLAACVSYESAPVDVAKLLATLEAREYVADDSTERIAPMDLVTFAVLNNPSLCAVRTQVGISEAQLVQAGLLADPQLSWDGMDALASQLIERTTSPVDFVSGFGLSITIPRPGELEAQSEVARWRLEAARRTITQVEWRLARDVLIACEDVLEAERLLEQNESLAQVAEKTREYFDRAKDAGAATSIQANLAVGDLLSIRGERVLLSNSLNNAKRRLNGLLGLPPTAAVPIREAQFPDADTLEPVQLVERAVTLRPDLATLHAAYQAAEERVRLQVARQYPQLALGTGITLVPGFFTRFNQPAIRTAIAQRTALFAEFQARVHAVRGEIHDACAEFEQASSWRSFLESELLPNAELSLQLARAAFDAGEVTLLEILSLQRTLVTARTRTTSAFAEQRRRHWQVLAASGLLLENSGTAESESRIR